MDNYEKFIQKARENRIDPGIAEKLKTRILDATGSNAGTDYRALIVRILFGWTEVPYLRTGMVVASVTVVVLILIQQGIIVDRIGSLESRIISTNTENILKFQKEMMHANATLVTMSDNVFSDDSIKVAGEDLLSLVRSYRELQVRYDELLEVVGEINSGDQIKKLPGRDKLKL